MSRQEVKFEGALTSDMREVLNDNFTEIYAAAVDAFVIGDNGTLAATGSAQGNAASIVDTLTSVSAADGTKGVKLPTASAGKVLLVYNSVATNGLLIYPATSGTINGGSANAAITIEGKTLAVFAATDSTNWAAIYTANT
jgi:hypothetical protein